MVKDENLLCQVVLPLYFNHSNLRSFVRQLNMYDFHKIKLTHKQDPCFYNPYFIRDKPELQKYIKRQSNCKHPKRVYKGLEKERRASNDHWQPPNSFPSQAEPVRSHSLCMPKSRKRSVSEESSVSFYNVRSESKKPLLGKRPALTQSLPMPLANFPGKRTTHKVSFNLGASGGGEGRPNGCISFQTSKIHAESNDIQTKRAIKPCLIPQL